MAHQDAELIRAGKEATRVPSRIWCAAGRSRWAACWVLVGRSELVQDLCQEVFLRLYQAGPRYRERGAFATWLYRIALNVARDAGRRRRHDPQPLADHEPAANGAPPEHRCEQQELAHAVAAALAELPESLREVLVLRHYEDMNFEAMGRLLHTPASTLKSAPCRGPEPAPRAPATPGRQPRGETMTCTDVRAALPALLYAELPAAEADTLRSHLAGCPACRAEHAALQRLGGAGRAAGARRPRGPGPSVSGGGAASGAEASGGAGPPWLASESRPPRCSPWALSSKSVWTAGRSWCAGARLPW